MAYDPTHYKIYCASDDNRITIIDGIANTVIDTIIVGIGPRAFTWNSVQNRMYVANNGGSSISVIRDSLTGVEESGVVGIPRTFFAPTILRGPLQLPEGKKCKVFDITGRVVEPGKMQPGIYFIEIDGVVSQKVVKVR